ncbi:MAG TPA: DUF4159 domain-containing protein [Gemmatimonadaceae bacterium]|nr:DUF4159 domain-containing protein [Gemmatimonadaceae bacterium]
MSRLVAALCLLVFLGPVAAGAPPHPAPQPPSVPARLTIARLQYGGGGDWYVDQSALPNLLAAIAKSTSLHVEPAEVHVKLTDDRLWDFPYLFLTGHGNIHFTDEEVVRLREYLEHGGFLHADDNYGMDTSFRREIKRVFPDRPLVNVPLSNPIYHIVYDMPKGIPKIMEHDGKPAQGLGIFLGNRLAVYYSYQTDLSDGWENPDIEHVPAALHEAALRMGVNLFVYAVTSRPIS